MQSEHLVAQFGHSTYLFVIRIALILFVLISRSFWGFFRFSRFLVPASSSGIPFIIIELPFMQCIIFIIDLLGKV